MDTWCSVSKAASARSAAAKTEAAASDTGAADPSPPLVADVAATTAAGDEGSVGTPQVATAAR